MYDYAPCFHQNMTKTRFEKKNILSSTLQKPCQMSKKGCRKRLLWMSPNNGVRLCIVRIFAFEFGLLGKLSNSDIT